MSLEQLASMLGLLFAALSWLFSRFDLEVCLTKAEDLYRKGHIYEDEYEELRRHCIERFKKSKR